MGTERPRVWVTGIGLKTCLSMQRDVTWERLKAGHSGACVLERINQRDRTNYVGFPLPHSDHKPWIQALKATMDALTDAGLFPLRDSTIPAERRGIVVGFSKGDLRNMTIHYGYAHSAVPYESGKTIIFNCAWPSWLAHLLGHVDDCRGTQLTVIAACASGVVAALRGADLIRRGECDVVLVGAGDSQHEPLVLAAFQSMRVLANRRVEPKHAVRPLDRNRTGFLPGEGASILVLERADHAKARGAKPYAELVGGALGSDAYHITNQNPDPAGLAHVIRKALRNSEVDATEIDHINLHATATRSNDPIECQAIRRVFGPHTDTISCCANKAQIGHLLGAAGAAELAITCLSIRDGFVPPTINLDDPDPACDVDATPHVGRARPIRAALKIALGFGGHQAVAVLRQARISTRGKEVG